LQEKCGKGRGQIEITQRRRRLYLMQGKKVLCIVWRRLELAVIVIAKVLIMAPLYVGLYISLERPS
jgi:hypothetical protein